MNIISVYRQVGTYRGAAELCGTTHKTVKRVVERAEAGGPPARERRPRSDYSVHLRHDGSWWIVDTVNDRGQRHNDEATLSTFELAEKYLIWNWASSARGVIGAPRLGPRLYGLGYSKDVEAVQLAEGVAELRSSSGKAILLEPYATIFSHLMSKPVDDIDQMAREGIA